MLDAENGKEVKNQMTVEERRVARRHREMAEGVWASPPGKVLARFCGNNRQQVKAAARIFVFCKTLFLLSGILG